MIAPQTQSAHTWRDFFPDFWPDPLGHWTYSRLLVPAQATRGVITLTRVRGHLGIWASSTYLSTGIRLDSQTSPLQVHLQVVPSRQAAGGAGPTWLSALDPNDEESDALMWQKGYIPTDRQRQDDIGLDPGVPWVGMAGTDPMGWEFDCKTGRTWDRAQYELRLMATVSDEFHLKIEEQADVSQLYVQCWLRALFKASDGV